jgi:hypothetical protein
MRVEELRETLLRLAAEDGEVRERLAADGSLFDGYNSLMAIVHRRNGDHLADIVDAFGWPGFDLVGEDGADAAWLICKHAIAQPELQRRMLPLVEAAVAQGDAPPWHAATLEDGIRFYEGRPQVYGTMWDWDSEGRLRPWTTSTCRRWRRRPARCRPRTSSRPPTRRPACARPPTGPARSAGACNNGVRPLCYINR